MGSWLKSNCLEKGFPRTTHGNYGSWGEGGLAWLHPKLAAELSPSIYVVLGFVNVKDIRLSESWILAWFLVVSETYGFIDPMSTCS